MKKENDINCTINKMTVNKLIICPESLYTLMYLSEKISLENSLNLFSNSDFVTAINTNENINKAVAQSLFSTIRGCSTFSIISVQNY
jgi:hypothetical protein